MAQREDDDGDDSIEVIDDNENNCHSFPPAKRMKLGKCWISSGKEITITFKRPLSRRFTFSSSEVF